MLSYLAFCCLIHTTLATISLELVLVKRDTGTLVGTSVMVSLRTTDEHFFFGSYRILAEPIQLVDNLAQDLKLLSKVGVVSDSIMSIATTLPVRLLADPV